MERLLQRWFEHQGRDLPWRHARDPYAILVSEVMLQQTHISLADLSYLQGFTAGTACSSGRRKDSNSHKSSPVCSHGVRTGTAGIAEVMILPVIAP